MEQTHINTEALDMVMEGLMSRYKERVPAVGQIFAAMLAEGIIGGTHEIENDHIAFRTLGIEHLGVRSLEKIFLHYGYQKRSHYYFEGKKLDAWWYSPPRESDPRIFISELRVSELSKESQRIIQYYTNLIETDPVDALDLDDAQAVDSFLHSPLWQTPTIDDYNYLLAESEYAAWVIFNRYYLNHFTISLHHLPEGYNTVAAFNDFLEAHGIRLNTAGGKIKTSPDGGLIQSATVAQMIEADFAWDEKRFIAGSYIEFAERKALPEYAHLDKTDLKRRHRRDGFEAANADKIFESTYTTQIIDDL